MLTISKRQRVKPRAGKGGIYSFYLSDLDLAILRNWKIKNGFNSDSRALRELIAILDLAAEGEADNE